MKPSTKAIRFLESLKVPERPKAGTASQAVSKIGGFRRVKWLSAYRSYLIHAQFSCSNDLFASASQSV